MDRERVLHACCVAVSTLTIGLTALIDPIFVALLVPFALISLILSGYSLGQIRANAVRVSATQLPEVYELTGQLSAMLGLRRTPALYVLQEDGALNAFAAKWLRRDIIVLYSDVAELIDDDPQALAFIVAHELTHVRRRHALWAHVLRFAAFIPGLYSAWSRACEFTCDRVAAAAAPGGAPAGLLVLAAGRRLHRRVDSASYAGQASSERGFWVWASEQMSSHPHLSRRVAALSHQPVPVPTVDALDGTAVSQPA